RRTRVGSMRRSMKLATLVSFLALPLAACSSPDSVQTSSLIGSDSATVILNGRRGGCTTYELFRGSPSVAIGNLLTSGGCPSEVAIFAVSNAMGLMNTADKWTDASGDVVSVPMRAAYVVPLNVFIMSGDYEF